MKFLFRQLVALCGMALLSVVPALACDGRLIDAGVYAAPACIPQSATRVVSLDPLLTLGMMMDLGVPVLGAPYLGIQEPKVRADVLAAGITDIGHPTQPSLEAIAALKPDLIIGASYIHGESYDNLSRIAPTLLIDHMPWKEHFRLIARMVDKSPEAEAMLETYENRVASIRARVPDIAVSVVRLRPNGFNVYLNGPEAYAPYAVLHEAGVRRTPYETTDDGTIVKRPDWEEVGALEGDVLLYVAVSGFETGQDDALEAEAQANPLWQALPAVAAGRAHRVGRGPWMGFQGVTSAHHVLDDIETYIINTP